MIRSMTGYGSFSEALEDGSLVVEMRSVNQRHLKVLVKGPVGIEEREAAIRELVGARTTRGRVDVYVSVERGEGSSRRQLDDERVRDILAALERLSTEFGVTGAPDLNAVVAFGGLLTERASDSPGEIPEAQLQAVAAAALEGLIEMRTAEGARIETDLRSHVGGLRAGLDEVEALAPARLIRERDRLRAAVAELGEGRELDPDRLAREIAVIADRWDVGEELVRARAHLDAFDGYLDAPSAEAVGKRLGFLVQELQREVNTLGAKANDTEISRHVVEMKNQIEKLREQVENVE